MHVMLLVQEMSDYTKLVHYNNYLTKAVLHSMYTYTYTSLA